MAITIGAAAPTDIKIGGTPVKRVYVGRPHVWPPVTTAIEWVGSSVAPGPANGFAVHTAGDLLVALGFGSSVAPPGWTNVRSSTSGTPLTLSYLVATSGDTQFPTLTDATHTVSYVFAGAAGIDNDSCTLSTFTGTSLQVGMVNVTSHPKPSLVVYCYHSAATSGGWTQTNPGGLLTQNTQTRAISNHQLIDTRVGPAGTLETITMPHNQSAAMRGIGFEVLAAAQALSGHIKGSKTKLYHLPDSPYYNTTKAAAVFDTEADAEAAGYTKYQR